MDLLLETKNAIDNASIMRQAVIIKDVNDPDGRPSVWTVEGVAPARPGIGRALLIHNSRHGSSELPESQFGRVYLLNKDTQDEIMQLFNIAPYGEGENDGDEDDGIRPAPEPRVPDIQPITPASEVSVVTAAADQTVPVEALADDQAGETADDESTEDDSGQDVADVNLTKAQKQSRNKSAKKLAADKEAKG